MAEKFEAFAERLRTAREKLGLSQYALAKLTGLSKQTLSKLETGRHDPSWSTVQLLALALGEDYRSFADPELTLPEVEEQRKRGRPRKDTTGTASSSKPRSSAQTKGEKAGNKRKTKQKGVES